MSYPIPWEVCPWKKLHVCRGSRNRGFKKYGLPWNKLKQFWSSVAMVAHVMIWTCMRRKNAELIVKSILEGCPPPRLILGQDDYSRLQSSGTKEVLQAGNNDAFFKDLPRTLFQGPCSQLWEDFKPNETNTLLIDDTTEKGALYNNGNVVVLPTWFGFLEEQTTLYDSLLPWLQDIASSDASVPELVKKKRHGLSPVPKIEFSRQMRTFQKIISGNYHVT
jgi:hypothetical protein